MRNLWQADQGAAVNNALLFDPMSGCCVSFIAIGAGFAFRGHHVGSQTGMDD